MRILIVEDDAVLGMVASAALEGEGHAVAGPAFSVAEAQALAASGKADLALVDINLDGHDEGIALARSLRAQFGIPSIFVSGQVAAARANRDAALGLLPKPYDIDDLIAIVARVPGIGARGGLPGNFEVFADPAPERAGA